MAHSKGVSLREFNKVTGQTLWRDEVSGDGGKRHLRRRLRRVLAQQLREEIRDGRA